MQRLCSLCIILFVFILAHPLGAAEVGDTVFQTSFDESDVLDRWTGSRAQQVAPVDKTIRISLPAKGNEKHASVTQKLPIELLRGTRLRISGRIKSENVEMPPQPYNGVKMMLILDGPGGTQWLQQDKIWGTFDWKEVFFLAAVPEDISEATLLLGIENTTGTAWFDDITITVIGKKPKRSAEKPTPPIPPYRGHDLPRLRGTMIQPDSFTSEDLKVLAGDWKANHVRWQLIWGGFPNGPADTATVEEFDAWIDKQCQQLDKMLPELERYGVRVALDLHTPPGGRLPQNQGAAMPLFHEKKFQDAFVATWQRLARKYKDVKLIWCYDLLNEAVEPAPPEGKELLNWRELALKTSKEIRKIDPEKAIVIEPAPWGDPKALEWWEPFDPKEVPNVVYSVHMYMPHTFTHQGVTEFPAGLVYPGKMRDGKYWDKEQIRHSLRMVLEFVDGYDVAMYIGEFGSIRWAPENSTYRYLKDCIEIFEEEGWDWAYHAFREWDGWSVEHSTDKNNRRRVTEPTDRELLLRSWFEKNER
jgi:hypothetical protein